MSTNLEHLYRQVIMDHYKSPFNKGLVDDPNYYTVHLHNPTCGDDMTVQYKVDHGVVTDIKHQGTGCSICCSSASVMSITLKNKSKQNALNIIEAYYKMLTNEPYDKNILNGDAIAYHGVSQFPARIKCATLAWKAIEKGLLENKEE
ncbi:MAG: SUF system NifU family Fe-S cluster assembly protein [Paracholeplasma sp.]|jgi:nitrogen fixation NifU-like protein|uniref:SUF system FeS cluster assembly protein n=1 Tax=Acholeplasma brassicae TaxID=61635 RepID=U4KTB7_9MOLU|nr:MULTISPECIES: SUF system NifU family Fe-S cluster assembly protein [Paracholeplasma]MDY3195422.1 SUF system NifU family Fe-S cluster assembly protein [Paracholeplasma sp.]CCV66409.1 SUF system FeS cluster assembly protein [Paracholeplasma brassicae]HBT60068.1 SUF system NifU family Fe-S cluster assembly protein [Acholeplasmataceae bacterium]